MGRTIQGGTLATKKHRKRGRSKIYGEHNTSFDARSLQLPLDVDNTYIHTYVRNFHRGLTNWNVESTLMSAFNIIMQPIRQHVEELRQQSKKYDNAFVKARGESILQYFGQPSQPLADLRFIKDTLQLLKMATSGYLVKKVKDKQTNEVVTHYYLSADRLEITNAAVATNREPLIQQITQHLMSINSSILNSESCRGLADQIVTLAEQWANSGRTAQRTFMKDNGTKRIDRVQKEIDALRNKFNSIQALAGQSIIDKLKDLCDGWPTEYRSGTIQHLVQLQDMVELFKLTTRNQDFGFVAEVLRSKTFNGKLVGDQENKATATDIEYSISGIDGITKAITESVKFYKNDIYNKSILFTGQNFINLFEQYGQQDALRQLGYFLTNYFTLGAAEQFRSTTTKDDYLANSTVVNIYDAIVRFIEEVAFFTAIYQGGAKNSIVNSSNALPMLMTVNNKTVFTYQVWDALLKCLNDPNPSNKINGQVFLSYIPGHYQKIRDRKRKITQAQQPVDYMPYQQDSNLQGYMKSTLGQYRSMTLGSVHVSVDIAKLMNNSGV